VGVAGGLALLVPMLRLGFPTTIAVTGEDGWSRVMLAGWLHDHALHGPQQPATSRPPLGAYNAPPRELGLGFELLVATVMAVLRRPAFEVVGPLAALSAPLSVAGWASLWRSLGGRLDRRRAVVLLVPAASPLLVFLLTDTYLTQLLGLSLVPFAAAACIRYARRRDRRSLLVAAVAVAGVAGVYPPLLPWLAVTVAAALLLVRAPGWPSRLGRAGRAAAVLILCTVVIAPIQTVRAVAGVLVVGGLRSNEGFPLFAPLDQLSVGLGARSPFSLLPFTRDGIPALLPPLVATAALLAAFALAAVTVRGSVQAPALAALALSAALPTAAIALWYGAHEHYGYGVVKAVASGGAIAAGCLVLALLVPGGRRAARLRAGALAAVAIVWIAVSVQTMSRLDGAPPGFRAAEVAFGEAVDRLPPGSSLLAEGVDQSSFDELQFRMMAAYFGEVVGGLETEGLGTTTTYISEGGHARWRPDRSWDYVARGTDSVVRTPRRVIFRDANYALLEAPLLDVTPYGRSWHPTERTATATFAWVSGSADLVISNRAPVARIARLSFRAIGYRRPRRLVVTAGGERAGYVLAPGAPVRVSLRVPLPARSATRARLGISPGPDPAPRPDTRLLSVLVDDLTVVPATPPIRHGGGWSGLEASPQGARFRWMGTTAHIALGARGERRPALRATVRLSSLARPRVVEIRAGGALLTRVRVPSGWRFRTVSFDVPAGEGQARLRLSATPPAEPASIVNPQDPRLLAVAVGRLAVTPR
jgi:hypothetical protein